MIMAGRYYIETFGCQMNVHDSETIAGVLSAVGWEPARDAQDADLVLLNTCSVRKKPHDKVYSRLGELRRLRQRRPGMLVGVCGCMAQIVPDDLRKRAPYVDLIVGTREYASLPQLIAEARNGGAASALDLEHEIPEGMPVRRANGVCAWVTAIYGCDNFCAYCVVPYARGRERSRRPEHVIAEVRQLANEGFREVTLLGQNVNTYGRDLGDGVDFADLLTMANEVRGIERIRFTTSHPKDCSERLIQAMATLPKVCEHLHLPVQSGDDAVLARMNRTYTAGPYVELVERVRAAVPGVAITTDVMVGFPGETEGAFRHTLDLFAHVRYDQAFMFKYNNRPGIAAAQMPDQVPEETKQERLLRLIELQNRIGREVNRALVGEDVEVLVEGPRRGHSGQLQGRTRTNKLTLFNGPTSLVGRLVTVRVEEGFVWGLKGQVEGG